MTAMRGLCERDVAYVLMEDSGAYLEHRHVKGVATDKKIAESWSAKGYCFTYIEVPVIKESEHCITVG